MSLLILENFDIAPISEDTKQDLLELLDGRSDNRSTLTVGQLDPSECHNYLGSPHLADAIVDWLT